MGVRARGFTLVELLVVLVIVGLVSILAIPAVVHSYAERDIRDAVTLITTAMSTARDMAARDGKPHGIRLGWDLTISRWGYPDGTIGPPPAAVTTPDGQSNEIMFNPDGSAFFAGEYAVPTMAGLKAHEAKIHVVDRGRQGYEGWITLNVKTGLIETDIRTP